MASLWHVMLWRWTLVPSLLVLCLCGTHTFGDDEFNAEVTLTIHQVFVFVVVCVLKHLLCCYVMLYYIILYYVWSNHLCERVLIPNANENFLQKWSLCTLAQWLPWDLIFF